MSQTIIKKIRENKLNSTKNRNPFTMGFPFIKLHLYTITPTKSKINRITPQTNQPRRSQSDEQ